MSPSRLFAVAFIFVCTCIAWLFLGSSVHHRSGEADQRLADEVSRLWGGRHEQLPPEIWVERPGQEIKTVEEKNGDGTTTTRKVAREVTRRVAVPLESSRVEMTIDLVPRQKGLLWYDTWSGAYRARYTFHNPDREDRRMGIRLAFPSSQAIYDGFRLLLNGDELPFGGDLEKDASTVVRLPAGGAAELEVGYRTRGLGPWHYSFGDEGVNRVRDFQLTLLTSFDDVDFPAGTLSPTTSRPEPPGRRLVWQFESLVTGQKIGLDPPDRLNPGPFAARVTFFAPVALLFFMTVLVILGMVQGPSLHPMHWFFLSAAFFAFHLLLAYLVDHVDVHLAFALSALTSVFLVVSYLRVVVGTRYALVRAGLAQVVFLVLFGYSFFLEGYTGLTVTLGAIVTLFVLMQSTARVDWPTAFASRNPGPLSPLAPPENP